jgi:predicted branched-subunit amino acid permease
MTSIFICLLCMQRFDAPKAAAAGGAVMGVLICKVLGVEGPAILIGALVGVACAMLVSKRGASGTNDARDAKEQT